MTTFAEPWLPQLTSFTSTPSCTAKVVDKREKQTGCFATSNQHHGSQISTTFHFYSGEILWCFHMIIYYPHEYTILSPYFPYKNPLDSSCFPSPHFSKHSAFSFAFRKHVRQRDGLADGWEKIPMEIWGFPGCNLSIYHLVLTNIAMENPWTKWRFRSLGKSSISIRAIYTMAMLNNQRVNHFKPIHWTIS